MEAGKADVLAQVGAWLSGWMGNPYVVALIVPFGFYVIGAFGKKMIREHRPGDSFFMMSDWYLAPDAALANIGVGLTECVDRIARFDPSSHHGQLRGTVAFVALAFFVYLIVLCLHKHYESDPSTAKRVGWLLFFANVLAFVSMFVFLLAFKGVGNA